MLPNETITAIRITGLTKRFPGSREPVFSGIDLAIPAGHITFLLGPSGAGKSVLLKHIVGLMKPDRGSIDVFGSRVPYGRPSQLNEMRKHFGLLFQNGALFDSLSVYDNVAFPLRMHKNVASRSMIRSKVETALCAVDLNPKNDGPKFPAELSGGMRKRVALARAIVLEPEILLYDEPTTGLDPLTRSTVEELIVATNKKYRLTSLVISHDVVAAMYLADQIAFLCSSKIVFFGTPYEFGQSKHPVIMDFVNTERRCVKELLA
jgi:phospholipid/cholesterol/gamma-HCH transport system ATP-binding protein